MAEVPEVEIIVRDLREAMIGRTIRAAEVLVPAAVRFPTIEEFTSLLIDRMMLGANRRAKYILVSLSGDLVLVPSAQLRLPETLVIWTEMRISA